jgi:hypothetical protein
LVLEDYHKDEDELSDSKCIEDSDEDLQCRVWVFVLAVQQLHNIDA